jgi:glycosyltransferase involved in cell wall biosynthesis
MKVLITVPRLAMPGGVANYYRALRSHLDERKVFFEVGALPTESGALARAVRLVRDSWRFHRLLARDAWDLVHINPSMVPGSILRDGLLIAIARAHGRRVLVFFRGWDPACAERIRRRFLGVFRRVYGGATAFVVLATEFRTVLSSLGIDRPTFLSTTVVDEAFVGTGAPAGAARSTVPGRCNVLFLCRLDIDKGLPESIEAFALAKARWPAVTLTVVGDGPDRARAEAVVARLGLQDVRFLGHIAGARKIELFDEADVYLFPTAFFEGMPNSLLEAMASGLPVITRPVGGIRDFFEHERMGFITESRDPRVLAGFLERLIADPALRLRMGAYNREYAVRHFAASVVVQNLLGIYAQVGGQPQPGGCGQSPTMTLE